MKFMPAHREACGPHCAWRHKARLAIAQMQAPLGKAGGDAEQACHGVRAPCRILDRLPQYHVAAAFPMHWPRLGKAVQSVKETPRLRKFFRMKFRIAAGKPAYVAGLRRRFVGKRRERNDFSARPPPAFEKMSIDECESGV